MTYKELIEYYKTPKAVSDDIGCAAITVYTWARRKTKPMEKIPWQWQCTIEKTTNGVLKASKGPFKKKRSTKKKGH